MVFQSILDFWNGRQGLEPASPGPWGRYRVNMSRCTAGWHYWAAPSMRSVNALTVRVIKRTVLRDAAWHAHSANRHLGQTDSPGASLLIPL